ncbi:MAG: SGNH/GDSL hydrolase family protein [Candidatus Eisenbacteria sp.]|nr:SGNH/GDSL hydrolase family protein [Candidatus Eisenbacteria bacterium]
MGRLRRTVSNVALSAVSVVIFFSILEIATRLLWHYEVKGPHVGLVLEEANRQVVSEEVEYRINGLGLRMNREVAPETREDLRRVLALGDSFVWGDGLVYEALVTVKLEEILSTEVGTVEVINAGVNGYNTTDELEQLIHLAPVCCPDLVIVFFFTNDLLSRRRDSGGGIATKPDRRLRIKEFLRTRSKFCAYLYYLYKDKLVASIGVPKFVLPADYFNLDDSKPGWVAFKKAALQIREECLQSDMALIFVMIPTLTHLDESYPYAELRRETKDFLDESRIRVIDLFDTYAPYNPSDLWISPENTHWNGLGTSLAAKEIVDYVKQHGLLPPAL